MEADDYDLCCRVAKIMGPASAAAKALACRDRLLASGIQPMISRVGNAWVVNEPRQFPAAQPQREG